jgi:hypothetical protein
MSDTTHRNAKTGPSGISAAAIEGAKQGEQSTNPDKPGEKLARPAPGATRQSSSNESAESVSSTNEQTGITGGVRENQEDEDQEWRRASDGDGGSTEEVSGTGRDTGGDDGIKPLSP